MSKKLSAATLTEDDLWFAAAVETLQEREGFIAVAEAYTPKQQELAKEISRIANFEGDLALAVQYSEILECEADNYDSTH